jgi:hypothetical protein
MYIDRSSYLNMPYVQEGIAKEEGERRIVVVRKSCRWLTAFRTTQALAESLRSKVLV